MVAGWPGAVGGLAFGEHDEPAEVVLASAPGETVAAVEPVAAQQLAFRGLRIPLLASPVVVSAVGRPLVQNQRYPLRPKPTEK